jgi:hypothetical protein
MAENNRSSTISSSCTVAATTPMKAMSDREERSRSGIPAQTEAPGAQPVMDDLVERHGDAENAGDRHAAPQRRRGPARQRDEGARARNGVSGMLQTKLASRNRVRRSLIPPAPAP